MTENLKYVDADAHEEDDEMKRPCVVVWTPAVTLVGCEPTVTSVAGRRRSPETWSVDSDLIHSWSQLLREHVSLVESRLLIDEPAIRALESLARNRQSNALRARQVPQRGRIPRLHSRNALRVVCAALENDGSSLCLTEQAERRAAEAPPISRQ